MKFEVITFIFFFFSFSSFLIIASRRYLIYTLSIGDLTQVHGFKIICRLTILKSLPLALFPNSKSPHTPQSCAQLLSWLVYLIGIWNNTLKRKSIFSYTKSKNSMSSPSSCYYNVLNYSNWKSRHLPSLFFPSLSRSK